MMNPKLLVTTALIAAVGFTAFAAETATGEFDKEKVCKARRDTNEEGLVNVRKARPNEAEMRTQLLAMIQLGVANGICLSDMLGKGDEDIAALLQSIASTEDDIENIAPAAGPDGAPGGDFGPTGDIGGENPSQLNEPTNTPPASPLAPEAPSDESDFVGEKVFIEGRI